MTVPIAHSQSRGLPRLPGHLPLVILLAGMLLALVPKTVLAHADIERSEPAASAALEQGPKQVTIWFTEPIEPAFSDIRVLEASGGRVDRANPAALPGGPTAMSVGVASLPPGVYTVAWRNTSRVDGHSVRGSFVFSVGRPISEKDVPKAAAPPLFSSPLEPALRWTTLLSAMALTGGLSFLLLVARPALAGFPRAYHPLRSRIRRVLWAGAAVLFLSEIARLAAHAAALEDIPLYRAAGSPAWPVLAQTDWGHLWLWRIALLACFVLAMVLPRDQGAERSRPDRAGTGPWPAAGPWFLLALSMGMLLTISLASHSAALEGLRLPGIVTDYAHLVAAAFWVGGVLHMAAGLPILFKGLTSRQRRHALSGIARRFSLLATLSVGTLAVTGAYSGWALVGSWPALARTAYGITLIAKTLVVMLLMGLGAVNLLWVGPRLAASERAGPWLQKAVTAEALLAAAVILAVGVLTSLQPARQEAARTGIVPADGTAAQAVAGGLRIDTRVSPGEVGSNRLAISLKDRQGRRVVDSQVAAAVRYLGMDLGATPVTPVAQGDGTYVVEGALLTIAGPWRVDVQVRRPGFFDTAAALQFEIAAAGGSRRSYAAPSPSAGMPLWGIEVMLVGLLFVGASLWRKEWRRGPGLVLAMPGAAAIAVGTAVVLLSLAGGRSARQPEFNPFPSTPESAAIGQQVYLANCETCHGAAGKGDGPSGAALVPGPLDLTVHAPLHDDAELYRFISKGVAGTAMAAWERNLTPAERWHVVNYLRALAPQH